MIDTPTVLREYLITSGTGLYTLCGTRIWTPEIANDFTNSQPCIVFHQATERTNVEAPIATTLFVFKCYGGSTSYATARSVAYALYDRLHNGGGKTTSGKIVKAHLVTGMQVYADPDTKWPTATATYEVTIHA